MTVGLTGGIGSGKTTVARIFEMLGCAVFDSDQAAKDAYFNEGIPAKVKALLGEQAYTDNHHLNRSYISDRVFGNTDLLGRLNAILHPAVREMFTDFIKSNPGKLIVKESALLFEAGVAKECDRIVVVAAPEELRISRVMSRDHIAREVVEKRLKSQLAQEEKVSKADFVILNDETRLVLPQVLEIHNSLSALLRQEAGVS
jgi:dephospho-CoA kinase